MPIWPFRRKPRVTRRLDSAPGDDESRTTTARTAVRKPATPPPGGSGISTARDEPTAGGTASTTNQ